MKARTAKRLAILIAVLSLVGGTGFFTQQYQVNRLALKERQKAELASKEGDFAKAETLFRELVRVFPRDQEIQIRHADTLLKVSRSMAVQNEASQIYRGVLKRSEGREDVRRSLIELKFDMQPPRLISSAGRDDGADVDLKILLDTPKNQNDPHLLYLMGRCEEAKGNDAIAAKNAMQNYRRVVENKDAVDRIDAGSRLAILLLSEKVNQPEEAQAVINKLVEDTPNDYRSYLARGEFWLGLAARDQSKKPLESEAKKDFEEARKRAPTKPEVYLQQAQAALSEGKSGIDGARLILKAGLKNVPTSKEIYQTLANVEYYAGNLNKAIDVLELGVKGIELRLMSSLKDVSGIPANGKNLIIVAAVEKVLHIRIFDAEGKVAVDTDEKKLAEQAQKVEKLRTEAKVAVDTDETKLAKQAQKVDTDQTKLAEQTQKVEKLRSRLESLGSSPAQELTKSDKDLIITDVASLVGDTRWAGQTDQNGLRYLLTDFLAKRGDTGKLLPQIEELKKIGYSPILIQYFTACYHINANQFLKARQILSAIQAATSHTVDSKFKSRINVLLAQCYSELGEPEMQQNAYLQALTADPQDLTAKLGWIQNLINQGDITGAIREYSVLAKQVPFVRPKLARLLIAQNRQRPESQRNWTEVTELINLPAETKDQSVECALLRAELFIAQGNQAAAGNELEKAKAQFPKNVQIWIAQVNLTRFQGRADEALSLLNQAKEQLGDLVELRLERARLWATEKGPQFHKGLMDLSQGVEKFSPADRKRLLNGLAFEMLGQQNLEGASQLWRQLAAEHPADIDLRLKLLELALQNTKKGGIEKDIKDGIERDIKQIEEIEGNEGPLGRYCQVKYLIWQLKRAEDKETKQAIQYKARVLLEDLASRRGDWSLIPLASAELAEEELRQGDFKEEELREKEERIIGFYQQAIKLGHRGAAVVRRTVQLLIKNEQGDSALELLGSIPMESQLAGEEKQAARFAVEKGDFQHAEQIARKAVQAKPNDFSERIWLVQILLANDRRPEAEKELRDAIVLSPVDPDRWVALVTFMIFAKQPVGAEKVIQEAEAKLPPSKAPLALAICCEKMGRFYDMNNAAEMKRWNDTAKVWYEKAAAAKPEDLTIKRRLTEFFLKSRQTEEAQKYLETISKLSGGAKNEETTIWAKRALAVILASGTDRAQASKALAIFEPDRQPVPAGQEGKSLTDPEDLRILAGVLDMQKTIVHRKRAIEILETLADKNRATTEDRFFMARLCEAIGDLPKAREKYQDLDERTETLRDMETLNRRPYFLAQFAKFLLQHRKSDDQKDLAKAQKLVDQIKELQPEALEILVLQVEIHRIRDEVDEAAGLIQAFADHTKVAPQVLLALAGLAEKIKQMPLAKQLYDRYAILTGTTQGKLILAAFLGRNDRVKEGLDICEPLWMNGNEVRLVSIACMEILFGPDGTRTLDPIQIDRVAGWFEQEIARAESQKRSNPWLFTGLGNLRERQDRFSEAAKLYHRAVQADDRDGVSLNNLAWLAALNKDKKQVKEALGYANRAIALKPDQPDFLDTRGMVYLIGDQPTLALEDFQRAVTIDPSSASKHFHLAQAYLANNDKERARQSLNAAKAKGFTPSSLHVLERQNCQSVLNALGSS